MQQDLVTRTSYYYTKRIKLRRKFVKMSAISDMKKQLVCAVKIRHRQRHDSVDFMPLLHKANDICHIHTVVADKGYDSEKNHVAASNLGITSIIPPRYEYVPVYKTRGYHRKMLKRQGYDSATYHQRNKTETIFSVIKRMFGENVTSRKISTQNRELMYRVIAYNAYRITMNNLLIRHGFYTALLLQNQSSPPKYSTWSDLLQNVHFMRCFIVLVICFFY